MQAESRLGVYGPHGCILRDAAGNTVLECMCGHVLQGRFDPTRPFFTAHGSFWTNSTTALLASTTPADHQGRPRNRCHAEGYESVALIPLLAGQQVVGLLQFNDRRPSRFTPESIAHFESMADSLAVALSHRQAEDTLRKSEERHRTILQTAMDGFWLADTQGRLLEVNAAYCRMIGYSEPELLGMRISDLAVVDASDNVAASIQRIMTQGEGRFESRHRRKDGNLVNVEVSAQYRPAEGGRIVAFLRDITRRKRAEQSLRESEIRWRSYVENAPYGVFVADERGRYVEVNAEASRVTGYTESELLSMSIPDLLAPESRQAGMQRFAELAETGRTSVELRYVTKEGEMRWWTVAAVRLSQTRYLGYTHDITERKRVAAYGEMVREILQILNEPGELRDSMQRVLAVVQTRAGFDAVGIRLQDGDDVPYFVQRGFSADFLRRESSLIQRGADGWACRDGNGKARLECTCGLVLSGKTDPSDPLFTRGGSFWTNDSSLLLELPPDRDPRLNPRNECLHQGYASIALVPIRMKGQIVGLLQLNGLRKGCLSLAGVEHLENIVAHLGEAFMRKQAEEALRRNESLLNEVQRLSKTGGWEYDAATGCVHWTDEVYRIYGVGRDYDPNDVSRSIGFYAPESIPTLRAAFQRAVERGEPYDLELQFIRANGERIWVRTMARPLVKAGRVVRLAGNFMDITERRQAEAANRQLIETLDQRVSQRTAELNETVRKLECEVAERQRAAEEKARLAVALAALNDLAVELTASHTVADVQAKLAARLMDLTGAFAVGISAYHAGSRELVLEQVAITPLQPGVLEKVEAGLGRPLLGLCMPVSQEAMGRILSGPVVEFENLCEPTFGMVPEATAKTVSAKFGLGKFYGMALTEADELLGAIMIAMQAGSKPLAGSVRLNVARIAVVVLRRVQAEQALARQQAELAHLARVAVAGELVTGVAHELNQPLGAMLLYAETCCDLLEKGTEDRGILVEPLRRLVGEAERARDIVAHLRKFIHSRVMSLSAVRANSAMRNGASFLAYEAMRAQVEIVLDLAPSDPWIAADAIMLEQVIVNLAMNALHALQQVGDRPRKMILSTAVGAEGSCTIGVRDNGPGLAAQVRPQLFEPFVTTKPQGLGLGLSICRSIIERHGGTISYRDAGGGGASFEFTLPPGQRREP